MEELVRYIVKSLVTQPDMVKVEQLEDEDNYIIQVSVANDDIGKIIGRQGRIARSIRTIVKAASTKATKKYMVEIL